MPGDNYQYSNYTAALAGFLVECITGIKLRDHSIDNLFVPLGMTNSGWTISNFPDPLLVAMPYDNNNDEYGQYNWAEYPDGQLRSSPNDMAEYMAAMLGGGRSRTGVRVLESASVDTAFADVFPGNPASEDQGVFWYRDNTYGEPDAGHSGWTYGVSTDMCLLLDSRVGVAVLINQDGSGASTARNQVMDLLVDRGKELASQTCAHTCGDQDGAGVNVDAVDLGLFAACWGEDPSINLDCACANLVEFGHHVIDLLDFSVLAELFMSSSSDYPPNNCSASMTDPYAPSPDPMSFATAPYATGDSSIAMVATTATDISGVEYYFTCLEDAAHDSDWQDSTRYDDTGLALDTQYTYTVKARDKSAAWNETAASSGASATTFAYKNNVLPANGGVLESFTSEYGSGWVASDLTNGVTNEDGWASATNPASDQEFIYSFLDGNNAELNHAIIHGGTAEGSYYSRDVEVWTSLNGTSYTIQGSDELEEQPNDSVTIPLGDIEAKKVKLVVTSGYSTSWWELAEFEVYGEIIE